MPSRRANPGHYVANVGYFPDSPHPWRVRMMIDGVTHKANFRLESQALAYAALLEGAAHGLPLPVPELTIGDLWAAYQAHLAASRRAVATIAYYGKLAERLLEYHGDQQLVARIDQEAIRGYMTARRAAGCGEAGLLKELSALRAWYRECQVQPAWRMPKLRPEIRTRRVPQDAEIALVFRSLQRGDLERAVLLSLLAGLRPSEALAAEVSWRSGTVLEVVARKTATRFSTWICPTLAAALDQVSTGRYVPLSETALRHALWRRTTALQLPHVWTGLEGLRHACGTWAHEAGATEEDVDLLLGHVKPGSMAQRHYLHAANVTGRKRWLRHVEARFLAALTA